MRAEVPGAWKSRCRPADRPAKSPVWTCASVWSARGGGVPRSLLEFMGRRVAKLMEGQLWATAGRGVVLPTHLGRVFPRGEPGQEERTRFWQYHRCRWASRHSWAGLSSFLSQGLWNFAGTSLCWIPIIHPQKSPGRCSLWGNKGPFP